MPVYEEREIARQTAGRQSSSRACVEKTTFCKTKLPATSRQAEPVRKKTTFCKTNCRLPPAHQAMKNGGLVGGFVWVSVGGRPSTPWIPSFAGMTN